jgi:hypothetical protein
MYYNEEMVQDAKTLLSFLQDQYKTRGAFGQALFDLLHDGWQAEAALVIALSKTELPIALWSLNRFSFANLKTAYWAMAERGESVENALALLLPDPYKR